MTFLEPETAETPESVEGQVEAGETELPEATPQELIDLEQFGSHYVPIKVDGEESTVPLSELRDGYQRQADYTRKSQALAEDRQRLSQAENIARALENDPEGTIRVLQATFAKENASQDNEEEILDPLEQEVRDIQSWRQQQEAYSAENAIAQQLETIHRDHGVDPEELVNFAMEHQIPRLDWALWGFQQQELAAKEFKAEHDKGEAERLAAKRGASAVDGGTARATGSVVAPTKGHATLTDAWNAAKQQLGAS